MRNKRAIRYDVVFFAFLLSAICGLFTAILWGAARGSGSYTAYDMGLSNDRLYLPAFREEGQWGSASTQSYNNNMVIISSAIYVLETTAGNTNYILITSSGNFIQNRNTLQSGSTFYVSSGSVTGTFTSYGGILGNLTGNVTGISAGTTLLGGATSYIQVSTTATGGTFHVSSGTVDGTMTATGGFTGTASNASNLEGTDLGTLTDTKYCTYDLAGTEIDCNADVSGMTPGATYYLGIGDTLQAGSTVYASSISAHNTTFLGRNTITSGVGAVFGYPATWTDDQSANAPVAWEVRRGPGVPGAWLDWYSGWTSPSLKIGQGGAGGNAGLVVAGNQTTGFNAIFTGNAGAMDYTADDPNWRINFCSNHVHGASCINNGRIKGGYLDAAANGGWRLGWDAINSSGDYYQWLAVKTNTSATTEVGIDAKLCVGCGSLTTPVSSKFDVLNGSITVRGTETGLRVQSLASCGTIGTDAQGSMTCGTGGFSELSSTQTFTGQNTFSNLVTFSSNTIGVFQTFASSIAVFGANPPTSFTDVDLSPWVGKRTAVVMLRVGLYYTGTGTNVCSFRTNGAVGIGYGYSGSNISMVTRNSPQIGELMIRTDSNGVIEYQCETGSGYTIEIIVDAAWF